MCEHKWFIASAQHPRLEGSFVASDGEEISTVGIDRARLEVLAICVDCQGFRRFMAVPV